MKEGDFFEIFRGRRIVVGVCGSVAAYKSAELVSRLASFGSDVKVAMTKSAAEFVSPLLFKTLSRNPVACDMWKEPPDWKPEHISLSDFAELYVVAPATANTIGNFANGLAPDFVSSIFLAVSSPVLIAPAMNCGMWENFSVQKNVKYLEENGVKFVGPETGNLACGISGKGRMSEPSEILSAMAEIFRRS